jgi:alginate O-acetyltransferase complex protein AlgI
MPLYTPLYLLFLAITTIMYWLLPNGLLKKLWLVVVSYVFYAAFDPRFTLLLMAVTVVTYWVGLGIQQGKARNIYLWIGVLFNLFILGLFKYFDFFIANVSHTLAVIQISIPIVSLQLLLPIGISFYIFQAISYNVDAYQKRIAPAGFLDLALLLAFFPKLIAGPLVRPAQFLPQLDAQTRPDNTVVSEALQLLLIGLIKKVLIADSLASMASVAFRAAESSNALNFPAPLYWQGFYLYAFQIYADFSGYTDIARASAMLLGFQLPENFRQPYFAVTLGDFWNRWHITVTQWFREHLFFPLSRRLLDITHRQFPRAIQVAVNLITMAVIGFWHGANWTFIGWGLWHGVLLSFERLFNIKPVGRWRILLMAVITFHLVAIGWVFFGASSPQSALRFLSAMVISQQWVWLSYYLPPVLLTALAVFGLDWITLTRPQIRPPWLAHLRPIAIIAAVVVLGLLFILRDASGTNAKPFIYGQF